MPDSTPKVRVVVINFDGGQMTIDCLQSLMATDWPADRLEIVMVDNGSLDDVVERVRAEMPTVRVIEPLANTGFAGGCNLGIRAPGEFDLIALVNNDATVDPGWLRPLVRSVQEDPRVAAACPKMLFAGRFLEVELEVPDATRVADDLRILGIRLIAARLDGRRDDSRLAFDEGFFPAEPPDRARGEEIARWSWRQGRVRIAVDEERPLPATLSLQVVAIDPRRLTIRSASFEQTIVVAGAPVWIDVPLDDKPFDVINNVGSALYTGGFGGDRGFLERDHGQFEEPADVFAWCGGAVVLRRDYLHDVGLFDERLFLYYEDTDLSWRGTLRGWRYQYVPDSIIRHHHAQSAGIDSPVFRYHTHRNRPLVLAKNAPASLAWQAGRDLGRRTIALTVRRVILRPFSLRMPQWAEASYHWKVLRGYLRLLPGMLRDRGSMKRSVGRESVMAWEQHKDMAR